MALILCGIVAMEYGWLEMFMRYKGMPLRIENFQNCPNFCTKKAWNPFQSYDLAKNRLEVQKSETEQITGRRTTGQPEIFMDEFH